MKFVAATCVLALAAVPAFAAEPDGLQPDGLTLPPGFHATVVAEGLGEMTRHMAFRDSSHLYVSTERQTKDAANAGIIALPSGQEPSRRPDRAFQHHRQRHRHRRL